MLFGVSHPADRNAPALSPFSVAHCKPAVWRSFITFARSASSFAFFNRSNSYRDRLSASAFLRAIHRLRPLQGFLARKIAADFSPRLPCGPHPLARHRPAALRLLRAPWRSWRRPLVGTPDSARSGGRTNVGFLIAGFGNAELLHDIFAIGASRALQPLDDDRKGTLTGR